MKSGLLPNVFKEMFLMTNQAHSYNTRNSNTFYFAGEVQKKYSRKGKQNENKFMHAN